MRRTAAIHAAACRNSCRAAAIHARAAGNSSDAPLFPARFPFCAICRETG
jgi:hypothetical protein